jgi:hypothetical protein
VGTTGVERPVLLLLADHRELAVPCEDQVRTGVYPTAVWCAAERTLMVDGWQTVYDRGRPGYGVMIEGSGHASFMDLPFLPAEPGSRAAGGLATISIDSIRAWRIICDYLLAFFGTHLGGDASPLLGGPSFAHPEVQFGAPADLVPGPS